MSGEVMEIWNYGLFAVIVLLALAVVAKYRLEIYEIRKKRLLKKRIQEKQLPQTSDQKLEELADNLKEALDFPAKKVDVQEDGIQVRLLVDGVKSEIAIHIKVQDDGLVVKPCISEALGWNLASQVEEVLRYICQEKTKISLDDSKYEFAKLLRIWKSERLYKWLSIGAVAVWAAGYAYLYTNTADYVETAYVETAELPAESIQAQTESETVAVLEDRDMANETDVPAVTETDTPYADSILLWKSYDTLLSDADFAGLSKEQLRIARNEIYAAHGRIFTSQDLIDYFNAKPWYQGTVPADQFDDSVLTETQKTNIAMIQLYEDFAGQEEYQEQYGSGGLVSEEYGIPQIPGDYTYVNASDDSQYVTLTIGRDISLLFYGATGYSQEMTGFSNMNDQEYYNPVTGDSLIFNDYGREMVYITRDGSQYLYYFSH